MLKLLVCILLLHLTFSISVDPSTTLFKDQYGRNAIFHGVNVVYKTFPFYPETQIFSANYSLTDHDLFNLKSWGMNMIRLHVAWQGVEPEKGQYNYSYVIKLREIIRKCDKFGIWVLLDAHQDLYSKKFCGEGFPDWVVKPTNFPYPLKVKIHFDEKGYPRRQDCLKIPFSEFYLTQDVMRFQREFFTNERGLMDSFTNMWKIVSSYMAREPNILGYELVNQPIGSDFYTNPSDTIAPGVANNKYLLPAYKQLYKGIREYDRENLIFFQPSIADPLGGGFYETPGGQTELGRQVFSYHIYCPYVTPLGQPVNNKFCNVFDQLEIASKQSNVQSLKAGGFLTEYGALSDSPKSAKQLQIITGLLQPRFRSWCYWQFKYYNDITTMARPGTTQSFYDEYGNLQLNKVKALARPYAPYICGDPIKTKFDLKTNVFILKWRHKQCFNMKTEIYLSNAFYFKEGFTAEFSDRNSHKKCTLEKLANAQQYYTVQCDPKMIGRLVELKVKPTKKNQENIELN